MLSQVARAISGILLLATFVLGAPDAHAAPGTSCKVISTWDDVSQTWLSAVVCDAQPGASGTSTPSSGGSACLNDFQQPIPCTVNGAVWTPAWGCYAGPSGQQPDAAHQGMTAYQCKYNPAGAAIPSGIVPIYWVNGGPAAVNPAALASQAVATMRLGPIRIGMVPEDVPGSMGIVGMPAWLWVDAPDAQTFGPASSSASAGGVTVTARAKVAKVLWNMGDGGAVTCRTAGSAFKAGDGGTSSPDCGYTYRQQGTYTIRATSTWAISWTATTGVTGTLSLSFTSTRTLVVGEIQVVSR
jgi:hypothetical protein